MPPGNKSGQAFVHDPRSIGSSVVKASVKLRFANQAGQTMVVVRSMEVQQKKTSLSFKQLDGVIRTAASGQKKSMSHKCTGKC
jgi:DNA repair protein RAD50